MPRTTNGAHDGTNKGDFWSHFVRESGRGAVSQERPDAKRLATAPDPMYNGRVVLSGTP